MQGVGATGGVFGGGRRLHDADGASEFEDGGAVCVGGFRAEEDVSPREFDLNDVGVLELLGVGEGDLTGVEGVDVWETEGSHPSVGEDGSEVSGGVEGSHGGHATGVGAIRGCWMSDEVIERAVEELRVWVDGPFREMLPRLRGLGNDLEEATEGLNRSLAMAERAMAGRWGGRAAAVEIDDDTVSEIVQWGRLLVLKKGTSTVTPLLNSSRETRVLSAGVLVEVAEQLRFEGEP